jgi:hypothetical protein
MPEQVSRRLGVVLRPTVVIGLGGTGYETVLNLKTHFVEAFGHVPRIISLLVFDTTQNPNIMRKTAEGCEVSLSKGEFYPVTVSDPHNYVQANDLIQSWFPSNIPTEAVVNGAGQIRARGRLALFVNFQKFSGVIGKAIDNVQEVKRTAAAEEEGYEISTTGEVEIFVCSSLCGGTGAGTFLDVGWIAREGLGNGSHISGVFLLPRTFRKNVNPSYLVYKNTYGALKELDHWMSGHRPETINYGQGSIKPQRAPYDMVWLLDGMNRENRVIEEIDQLNAFAAQALFLLIGSQMGRASANTLDNILPSLSTRPLVNGKKACYLSFGVSRLTYPVRHMTEETALKEGVRLIREELLNGVLREADLEEQVRSFIDQQGLQEEQTDQVIDGLIRLPDGGRFTATINLAHIVADKNAALNASQNAQNRQQTLLSNLQSVLEVNYNHLLQSRLEGIDKATEIYLEQPNGIIYALGFLRKLSARLEVYRSLMDSQAADFQAKLQRIEVASAMAVVQQAAQRLLINRAHLRSTLAEYANAITEATRCQVEIERRRRAAQIFVQLLAKIRTLDEKTQAIKHATEAVLKSLEGKKSTLAYRKPQESAFERMIDPARIMMREVQANAREFLAGKQGKLIDWSMKEQKRIEQELLEYVRTKVRAATVERLEEALPPEELVHSLNQLGTLSAPLWQYNPAVIGIANPETTRYYIYGVESSERTVLRRPNVQDELPRGAGTPTFATTNDPQSIYQLQIEAGLPLFALKEVKSWKEEYDNFSLVASGHILAGAEAFPDLFFEEERLEALKAFCLGASPTYSIIRQEGPVGTEPKYYFLRKEGLNKERHVDLDTGRVLAFRAFSRNQDFVREVGDQIRQKERETPPTELIRQMTEYHQRLDEALEKKGPSTPIELAQQVRRELAVIEKYVEDLGTLETRL